mgnify:CR=1 FL=1
MRIVMISGASRGIGLAIARELAKRGHALSLGVRKPSAVPQDVREAVGGCLVETYDAADRSAHKRWIKSTLDRYGRIDTLVNNAGIVQDAQFKKMSEEQFDRVIDVNLKGVYNCTKAVVDIMLQQNSGVILNASSIVGIYGNFGQTNYAATKFGVIGMVKTWARELGRKGIRANAICPGFVETPILSSMPEKVIKMMEDRVPMGRLAKPEEIANTYAWLASDEASYINGAVIEVSGGVTI